MNNQTSINPKDIYEIVSDTLDSGEKANVDVILESGEIITFHDCFYDNASKTINLDNDTKISLKGGN